MNTELITTQPLSLAARAERAAQVWDEEWQLRNECIALAREALEHYKAKGSKKLKIPDISRLLELTSKLARLSTGLPTEHIEFSSYNDPVRLAEIDRELDEVFGKPIDVPSETLLP